MDYETGLRLDNIIERLELLRVDMDKLKKAANIKDKKIREEVEEDDDFDEPPKPRRGR